MPLLALLPISAFAAYLGYKTNDALTTPQETINNGGINLTKIAGYAIAGGLIYYFGKKIIK